MRIKRKKEVSESHVCARFGNFIIRKHGDGVFMYVRLTTADGGWIVDYRNDTAMYAWVLMLASDTKYDKILESWIVLQYHVSNTYPDPDYLTDIADALKGLSERATERRMTEDAETEKEQG